MNDTSNYYSNSLLQETFTQPMNSCSSVLEETKPKYCSQLNQVEEYSKIDAEISYQSPKSTTETTSKKRSLSSIDFTDLELLKVIGRGTFAQQVALARHRCTKDVYAIKSLDKNNILKRKQVEHTRAERRVLGNLGKHPFIVELYDFFQTSKNLHFVMEFCQGGELFYHLQQSGRFNESTAFFYAAEVLAALEQIHSSGIIYRDLKPENVLLDAQGHVRLVDFGFAKDKMDDGKKSYTFCGSPQYLSPEMLNRVGHRTETDLWSFGCFCYEMLCGEPPFSDSDYPQLFAKIRKGHVTYPSYLSPTSISFMNQLLQVDPSKRLTAKEAMKHPVFQSINWDDLLQKKVTPPIIPSIENSICTRNFDCGFTSEEVLDLSHGKKQHYLEDAAATNYDFLDF